jgi:hypothetical protein
VRACRWARSGLFPSFAFQALCEWCEWCARAGGICRASSLPLLFKRCASGARVPAVMVGPLPFLCFLATCASGARVPVVMVGPLSFVCCASGARVVRACRWSWSGLLPFLCFSSVVRVVRACGHGRAFSPSFAFQALCEWYARVAMVGPSPLPLLSSKLREWCVRACRWSWSGLFSCLCFSCMLRVWCVRARAGGLGRASSPASVFRVVRVWRAPVGSVGPLPLPLLSSVVRVVRACGHGRTFSPAFAF